MKSIKLPLLLGLAGMLAGCTSFPKDALAMSETLLDDRNMQSRKYESKEEDRLLAASSSVLQDLGFILDESEMDIGLIGGSKMRSAHDLKQKVAAVALGAMLGMYVPTDKEQEFRASVTTRPVDDRHIVVRVTFQRIVWNATDDITKRESLKEPEMYREFFDRLSKSIFLEDQQI
jgi:hypothetical protein